LRIVPFCDGFNRWTTSGKINWFLGDWLANAGYRLIAGINSWYKFILSRSAAARQLSARALASLLLIKETAKVRWPSADRVYIPSLIGNTVDVIDPCTPLLHMEKVA
jgi:hypothetical protein